MSFLYQKIFLPPLPAHLLPFFHLWGNPFLLNTPSILKNNCLELPPWYYNKKNEFSPILPRLFLHKCFHFMNVSVRNFCDTNILIYGSQCLVEIEHFDFFLNKVIFHDVEFHVQTLSIASFYMHRVYFASAEKKEKKRPS